MFQIKWRQLEEGSLRDIKQALYTDNHLLIIGSESEVDNIQRC